MFIWISKFSAEPMFHLDSHLLYRSTIGSASVRDLLHRSTIGSERDPATSVTTTCRNYRSVEHSDFLIEKRGPTLVDISRHGEKIFV